tara:strand:+ start:15 stop:617 length:603 start_codon:yes stop_codon:yes gene_type:complete
MADKRYTCDCGGKTVKCYHPCNAGCCPNGIDIGRVRGGDINPADPRGFGFDTAFDGRIRGGIKTPEFINENKMKKEFNIFDKQLSSQDNGLTNSANSNAPNSIQQRYKVGDIIRIHPLDIAGASRTIGQTIYDPISQKWKVDDGRPRGVIWDGGKSIWGCWGKCKVKTWWGGTKVKCPCNKGTSQDAGCECSGCMSGGAC